MLDVKRGGGRSTSVLGLHAGLCDVILQRRDEIAHALLTFTLSERCLLVTSAVEVSPNAGGDVMRMEMRYAKPYNHHVIFRRIVRAMSAGYAQPLARLCPFGEQNTNGRGDYKEHVWEVAHAVFGRGTAAGTLWVTHACSLLEQGQSEALVSAIQVLPPIPPEPGQARSSPERAVDYFTTHAARMRYPVFRAEAHARGQWHR